MDIEFKIDKFEGPLDLLLHLVKINKMNILDIEIEKITEQYLNYLNKMEKMNLEITSNYLVIASELIYIKSKMLLPRVEEEIEEDPREELATKLIEYQVYKEITEKLKEKERNRKEIYTNSGVDIKQYVEDIEKKMETNVELDDLVATFLAILELTKEKTITIKQENTFSDIICEVI